MTYVTLFFSPSSPAVAFLFFVLVSISSGSFSFLALLSLSLHSSALCSLGCMSCFRQTCKFRAAIASSESAANTADGPRREEGARPKPGEDSRIEIARPLPRRDDESRSDLRNVPGISSRDTVSRDPLLRDHSPTWHVPTLSWSPSDAMFFLYSVLRTRARALFTAAAAGVRLLFKIMRAINSTRHRLCPRGFN